MSRSRATPHHRRPPLRMETQAGGRVIARARARFAASMGAMRLRAASLCQTNNPAASRTRKMQLRYLQHVFRWTTKAGSFECSSFVLRKPAAPSRSMAVCGIILFRGERRAAHFPAGVGHGWSAASGARAAGAVVGEAGRATRAQALVSDAVQERASDTRRQPRASLFFLPGTRGAVHQRSVEDRKRSRCLPWTASPKMGPSGPEHTGFFRHASDFAGAKRSSCAFLQSHKSQAGSQHQFESNRRSARDAAP